MRIVTAQSKPFQAGDKYGRRAQIPAKDVPQHEMPLIRCKTCSFRGGELPALEL